MRVASPGPVLPAAVSGERVELVTVAGRVSLYQAGPAEDTRLPPLVLIHSVNAAGSAAEMRPLYEHYRAQRAVYALDEALLEYDHATTHQPGAEHAPLCFLSALLFSGDSMRLYEALKLPVWMVHGVRGDFVDYREKSRFSGRPNWSFDVLQTGALPYFDQPEAFIERYDRFLAGVP